MPVTTRAIDMFWRDTIGVKKELHVLEWTWLGRCKLLERHIENMDVGWCASKMHTFHKTNPKSSHNSSAKKKSTSSKCWKPQDHGLQIQNLLILRVVSKFWGVASRSFLPSPLHTISNTQNHWWCQGSISILHQGGQQFYMFHVIGQIFPTQINSFEHCNNTTCFGDFLVIFNFQCVSGINSIPELPDFSPIWDAFWSAVWCSSIFEQHFQESKWIPPKKNTSSGWVCLSCNYSLRWYPS